MKVEEIATKDSTAMSMPRIQGHQSFIGISICATIIPRNARKKKA